MFSTISNIRKTSALRLARPEQRRQMFMVETDATKQIWKTSQKVYCPCPLQRRQMFMVETDADPRMREREWWDEAALVRKHSYLQRSTLFQFGTRGNRWQQPVKLPQEPSKYQNHSQPSFFCHF